MPQVVEAQPRQACAFQEPLKLVRDHSPVQGQAVRAREHKAAVMPLLPVVQLLRDLPAPMLTQRSHDGRRHRDCPSRSLRLWLDQLEPPVDALEGVADMQSRVRARYRRGGSRVGCKVMPVQVPGDDVSDQLDSLLRRSLAATDAAERSGSLNQSAMHFKELRATIIAIGAWRTEQARQEALRYREVAVDFATLSEAVEMRTKILRALSGYPEARQAVADALGEL